MDSDQKEQAKSGMNGWLIAIIVISIVAVIGTLLYFYVYKGRGGNAVKNIGTPNLGAIAPPAVPSMTNVTGGNMGVTGGNARPSAPLR